jgi:hypothetical protein
VALDENDARDPDADYKGETDPDTLTLFVHFTNGKTYRGTDFPQKAWDEFVQARSIAQQTNRSERHVHVCLRQVIVEGKEYEGRKLIAVQGSGYALVAPNHSGKTKRPTRKQNGLTDEQNVLRDRANRKRASSEDQDDDPLAM